MKHDPVYSYAMSLLVQKIPWQIHLIIRRSSVNRSLTRCALTLRFHLSATSSQASCLISGGVTRTSPTRPLLLLAWVLANKQLLCPPATRDSSIMPRSNDASPVLEDPSTSEVQQEPESRSTSRSFYIINSPRAEWYPWRSSVCFSITDEGYVSIIPFCSHIIWPTGCVYR